MIYNAHYQLLVANSNYVGSTQEGDLVDGGVAALSTMKEGQIAIVNEDDSSNAISTNWSSVKRFSLYQKTRNDKGRVVTIKHSGAKPILTDQIRNKTCKLYKAGEPQYWQLVIDHSFAACCKDYTILFNLHNENIDKSQFPQYWMQEVNVKKECCEEVCGDNTNPFTDAELAFMIWREIGLNKNNYISANIALKSSSNFSNIITKHDDNGEAYFYITHNTSRHAVAYLSSYKDGKIYVTDKDSSGNNGEMTIADLFTLAGFTEGTDDVAVVFEIIPEDKYPSRNINLKYDHTRITIADVTFKDGFECATGIEYYKNDHDNYSKIYKWNDAQTSTSATAEMSFPSGDGYDVRNMEQYDSRRTLNSPYAFSNYAYTENGISFRSKEDGQYHMVSFGYQQHSDALGGEFPHPHGTTIVLEKDASHPLLVYNATPASRSNWYRFVNETLGLTIGTGSASY